MLNRKIKFNGKEIMNKGLPVNSYLFQLVPYTKSSLISTRTKSTRPKSTRAKYQLVPSQLVPNTNSSLVNSCQLIAHRNLKNLNHFRKVFGNELTKNYKS